MGRVSRLTKQTVYNWHPGAPVNDRGLGLNKMKGFSGSAQSTDFELWDGNTLIRGERCAWCSRRLLLGTGHSLCFGDSELQS